MRILLGIDQEAEKNYADIEIVKLTMPDLVWVASTISLSMIIARMTMDVCHISILINYNILFVSNLYSSFSSKTRQLLTVCLFSALAESALGIFTCKSSIRLSGRFKYFRVSQSFYSVN